MNLTGYYNPRNMQVNQVIMEASTSQEKAYIAKMPKEDIHQLNGAAVQRLYQTTLDRKACDFGDIPDSKGDIDKVKYMKSTKECLQVLDELFTMNHIPKDDLTTINSAISNIESRKLSFEYGFKASQDFSIILYNTVVMAIIDGTSMLVASYMDYIVGPTDTGYVQNRKFDKQRGSVVMQNLEHFNKSCANGDVDQVLRYVGQEAKENFTGTGAILVGAAVVVALSAVVPISRQLIYWFYRGTNSLSEYMAVQAQFLEMHRLAVENSKAHTPKEKQNIIKRQERVILQLRRAADKLAIKNEERSDFVKKELKKDSSLFSLREMESHLAKQKLDGTGFQVI